MIELAAAHPTLPRIDLIVQRSDALARTVQAARASTDTFALADTVVRALQLGRPSTDAVGVADAVDRTVIRTAEAADTVTCRSGCDGGQLDDLT